MPSNVLLYFLIPYVLIWTAMLVYLVLKIRLANGKQIKRLGYLATGFHVTCLWMVIAWASQGGLYEAAGVCYGFCTFKVFYFLHR
jgi:hypothetical protein